LSRTGQDETPRRGILIDIGLDVAEQFGHVLDLVENDSRRVPGEKSSGVAARKFAHIERFEVHVLLRERLPVPYDAVMRGLF
jgi:hypothetical protein